jgi:mycothiol synthase
MAASDRPTPGEALRELREEDAEQVAGIYRVAYGDARPIDAAEIVSWFHNTELKPEWLRVLEVDGRIVGYGDIMIEADEVALEVAAPGNWETFIEWAEQRAREECLPRVRLFFPAGHELAAILDRRGYSLWRSAYTMQIELDESPPQPPPPLKGIDLRAFRSRDAEATRVALNECFAGDPFFHHNSPARFREFYLHGRGFDPSLWQLAWDGDQLAGLILAFAESSGERDTGWIGSLGVRPPWRGRGLGETLLWAAFGELHGHGLRRVGLGVDTENETGALRLYERVGMRVVRQGDNWMLDLPN